jgi:hypothetical protein
MRRAPDSNTLTACDCATHMRAPSAERAKPEHCVYTAHTHTCGRLDRVAQIDQIDLCAAGQHAQHACEHRTLMCRLFLAPLVHEQMGASTIRLQCDGVFMCERVSCIQMLAESSVRVPFLFNAINFTVDCLSTSYNLSRFDVASIR